MVTLVREKGQPYNALCNNLCILAASPSPAAETSRLRNTTTCDLLKRGGKQRVQASPTPQQAVYTCPALQQGVHFGSASQHGVLTGPASQQGFKGIK
ncbi:hypothetical protein E2C01_025983 [Portunus trituberculatus]|uniref:Uncharacterized protein n=1 Tax=Portunus trituberculatus TaxID=210409 RepID=A0A5B7EGX0_PORTR|nr:hypothetical protein [Portunus trituberculatus]